MKNLREKLNLLEKEISDSYWQLKSSFDTIIFLDKDDIEEKQFDDYFDIIDDSTGRAVEVVVVKITPIGIHVVEVEDVTRRRVVNLTNFASTADRVGLVEMLYGKLKFN